ncbi:MAG: class I SAM-dependent methyltransferase [Steroidobacteraceae bacterium]
MPAGAYALRRGKIMGEGLRKLSDEQVDAFNREYVDADRFARVSSRIDAAFPDGEFTFLDIGGGNGRFADQLLERYPRARGTVLDNSELLLARNKSHPQKTLLACSAGELDSIRDRFDLVSLHWLLHHLVGDSYAATQTNQRRALASLNGLLTERGRISVFENDYQGWAPDPIPTWLIYVVTASRPLAPLARALGANTAGVGVCFNSQKTWRNLMKEAGLQLIDHAEPDTWKRRIPLYGTFGLGLRDVKVGHYWLRSRT